MYAPYIMNGRSVKVSGSNRPNDCGADKHITLMPREHLALCHDHIRSTVDRSCLF